MHPVIVSVLPSPVPLGTGSRPSAYPPICRTLTGSRAPFCSGVRIGSLLVRAGLPSLFRFEKIEHEAKDFALGHSMSVRIVIQPLAIALAKP